MQPSTSRGFTAVSRRGVGGGGRPSTSGAKRKSSSLSCNRCGKSLTTTIFRVDCDCLFCEDCTYSHFEKHSNCPCCRKTLGEDGFMELVIADPSNATQESLKNSFQLLFTKSSSNAQQLSHQQFCSRLIRSMDELRCQTRFVLKQLVADVTKEGGRSSEMMRRYGKMQHEITQLKQSSSSFRIQAEQTIADLQKKLHASVSSSQEKDNQLAELKNQNRQLKDLVVADGIARTPSSAHSDNSGGGGRRGPGHSGGSGGGHHNHHHSHQSQRQQARPPLQNIVLQQQGRSRSNGSGGGGYLARPVTGGSDPSAAGLAPTPILPPAFPQNRPSSTGSVSSFDGPSSNPSSFRDYSSGQGFVFSRHGKKQRVSGGAQPPSPTQAFAFNTGTSHGRSSQSQRNLYSSRAGGGYGRR